MALTSNQLDFMEDSPLYRQQLSMQRIRVAQFFSRLDILSEKATEYSKAAMVFARAGQVFAEELQRSWDDVEAINIQEEIAIEEALRLEKEKKEREKQKEKEKQREKDPSKSYKEKSSNRSQHHPSQLTSPPIKPTIPESPVNDDFSSPDRLPTLGNSLGKMASMVSTLASVTSNLSHFLEHFLVSAVQNVGDKYRAECKSTMMNMEMAMEQYNDTLNTRLSKSKKDHQKIFNKLNMFGQKKALDEEFIRICAMRREMEVKRYEHVQLLNEVCTARRMEVIEVLCASALSFVTFFHEGWFAAKELKEDLDVTRDRVHKRRTYFEKQAKRAASTRQTIAKSALPISYPEIFPTSLWYELANNSKASNIAGYLRAPIDDTAPYRDRNWKRRWHMLDQGQFYYLDEAEFYQPHIITNVLTCAARPIAKSEIDFVFELISPSKTYLFQAESEHEMNTWVSVFAKSTELLLGQQQTRNDTNALDSKLDVRAIAQQKRVKANLLAQLRKLNGRCADCDAPDPDWASINLGIMICIVCSGIHRSLGVHISKVRSMTLDEWDPELLDMMVAIGNERSNEIYEGGLNSEVHSKPLPNSSREDKEEFITNKYVKKIFLSKAALSLVADRVTLQERMFLSLETDDIMRVILYAVLDCDVNWRNPAQNNQTLLHHAAEHDAAICAEWLLQNNADTSALDAMGLTAMEMARINDSKAVLYLLDADAEHHDSRGITFSNGSSGSATPTALQSSVGPSVSILMPLKTRAASSPAVSSVVSPSNIVNSKAT